MTHEPDETGGFDAPDAVTERIGHNVTEFLTGEMRAGRIPASFLPLQSGVGNIANAVLGRTRAKPRDTGLRVVHRMLQDSTIPLIEAGRLKFASTTSLALSPEASKHVYGNLDLFRKKIILRPQEISNNPEIARRLGIISMNTAIGSTLGQREFEPHHGPPGMNGIGGSGDLHAVPTSRYSLAPPPRRAGRFRPSSGG